MEETIKIPNWLKKGPTLQSPPFTISRRKGFIEKNLEHIADFLKEVFEPEQVSAKHGLLQTLDPRARLFGILLLITTAAFLNHIFLILGFFLFVMILSSASGVAITQLLKRIFPVILFSVIIVFPAAFSFITPGTPVLPIITMAEYEIYVSKQGIEAVALLLLRIASMASLISLFLLTTGYADTFGALRSFPIPKIFVQALSMTFRFVMVLIKVAEDIHLARKARTIKTGTMKEWQGWLASRVWLLIQRSMETAEYVYLAMTARGFTGDIKTIEVYEMRGRDYVWIGFTLFLFFVLIRL